MTAKHHDSHGRITYYAVSGLLFPVTLVGYGLWVGKLLARRKSGVSVTAQGPLSARWFQHQLGTRTDEASSRLLAELPGVSPLGLRLTAGPMRIAHRLSGYVPKAFRYPFEGEVPPKYEASARVPFFDRAVEKYTKDQLVILGAGFDTRAFRIPDVRVKRFEVDMPETQQVKRETLARAGIDASDVVFVPADFEKDDWLAELVRAGFDPTKPAMFVWEGVIMYLDREAILSTLRKIAGLPKGTAVAFDYFTRVPLESKALYWRYARATTKAAHEPLKFGIDATPPSRERLAELLRSCGLTLVEHETLGADTAEERAWGGFAVAAVR
ncbi:MAG: class I SAM-dependent methyltransferase [Kofleriaceae bacterium]|nr:class I SAM-dependent methyltransferase [Kofleriaceae bacterium]